VVRVMLRISGDDYVSSLGSMAHVSCIVRFGTPAGAFIRGWIIMMFIYMYI
jgi:hypothetical protein